MQRGLFKGAGLRKNGGLGKGKKFHRERKREPRTRENRGENQVKKKLDTHVKGKSFSTREKVGKQHITGKS